MEQKNDSAKILIPQDEIDQKIEQLASVICNDLKGEAFVIIGVLTGAYMVVSDISKALWKRGYRNFEVDFIGASSYGDKKESSGKPVLTKDTLLDLSGKTVLIVEDIVETGYSLTNILNIIKEKNPRMVKTLVLLSKTSKRKTDVVIDYCGFEIDGNIWVEGYGLDTSQYGRGSPDIVARYT